MSNKRSRRDSTAEYEPENDVERLPKDWTIRKLERYLFQNTSLFIKFLQHFSIIAKTKKCPKCSLGMVLFPTTSICDGATYCWKCPDNKCYKRITLRENTFFYNSKLSMTSIITLCYGWFHGIKQKVIAKEAEIAKNHWNTTVNWYNFCRDVCREKLLIDNHAIGGPGKTVEIDESAFGKRKHNRGCHRNTYWVFGGIQRESNEGKNFFIYNFVIKSLRLKFFIIKF